MSEDKKDPIKTYEELEKSVKNIKKKRIITLVLMILVVIIMCRDGMDDKIMIAIFFYSLLLIIQEQHFKLLSIIYNLLPEPDKENI